MKNKVDILNLEWTSIPCRDRVISSLVCNYLRVLGFSVFEGSIFDGYRLIRRMKPKALFISNSVGAPINTDIAEYAKKSGIKCFSGFSEGNFRENMIHEFIWGHNSTNSFVEEALFVWSDKKKEILLKYYPELQDQVKVCGGIGFDIYQIQKYRDPKTPFLERFQRSEYSKIVGVGCFDFGPFYEVDTRNPLVVAHTSAADIHTIQSDRELFKNILQEVIRTNKDILFLLKEHPSNELGAWASAIEGLDSYQNVLVLKNEIPVFDCIAVSDIWITYESTTALEAWLLDKETCLLNPLGGDFYRDEISQGSPIYKNVAELQTAIDHCYAGKNIPGFREKSELRQKLVKDAIQWQDGFNHVRAGNIIADSFKISRESIAYKKEKIPLGLRRKAFRQNLFWKVTRSVERHFGILQKIPYINRAVKMRYFSNDQVRDYSEALLKEQKKFYITNGLSTDDLHYVKGL